MKIVCLVKFVPNLEREQTVQYDQTGSIQREKSKLIINPEDAGALAYALQLKKSVPSIEVRVVSMGPQTVINNMKDFIRLGADQAVLISDRHFQASDSYATSHILTAYLAGVRFDCIFTGTETIDGGTAHIGPQIAELLNIHQFSDILEVKEAVDDHVTVKAIFDERLLTLEIANPSVISMSAGLKKKLGFVRVAEMDKNVDEQFKLVSNKQLQLAAEKIGRRGSLTIVRKDTVVKPVIKQKKVVQVNEAGIDAIYQFLKDRQYV